MVKNTLTGCIWCVDANNKTTEFYNTIHILIWCIKRYKCVVLFCYMYLQERTLVLINRISICFTFDFVRHKELFLLTWSAWNNAIMCVDSIICYFLCPSRRTVLVDEVSVEQCYNMCGFHLLFPLPLFAHLLFPLHNIFWLV